MAEDYYALLDVEPDASEEAILRAYREKAAEHHPDVSEAADAEATFQRLNRAKDVLPDAERRRAYDRVGHDRFVDGDGPSGTPVDVDGGADQPGGKPSWPSGLRAFVEQFLGDHSRRGRGWSDRRAPGRSPFEVDLTERLRGAAGAHEGVRVGSSRDSDTSSPSPERQSCPKCRGRGTFVHDINTARGRTRRLERCERCGGSGAVSE